MLVSTLLQASDAPNRAVVILCLDLTESVHGCTCKSLQLQVYSISSKLSYELK